MAHSPCIRPGTGCRGGQNLHNPCSEGYCRDTVCWVMAMASCRGGRKGEALVSLTFQHTSSSVLPAHGLVSDATESTAVWHVIWTRSNCEQQVHDQLYSKGYEVLLPTIDKWSRRKQARCLYR